MTLSISQESKNALNVTNEVKTGVSTTWDEATYSWDTADGTWDDPGFHITKESKNNLSITNEAKT